MYSLDAWTGNILWFHETLCRYMVTKKVIESASETDDETEDAPQPEVKKTVNKKEVNFCIHLHSLDDLMSLRIVANDITLLSSQKLIHALL